MDWKDVAKLIAPLAPAAGSILGGLVPFPGASLIGQKFGEVIARQFGVAPTPEAVAGAVQANPNEVILARINAATETARAEIEGFTEVEKAWAEVAATSIVNVNATMRAELGHEHWFFTGWRPAAGWILDFYAVVLGAMLSAAAFLSAFMGQSAPLKTLTDAWPIFAAFFGVLAALVGVYVFARSKEKAVAIEAGAPMPNATPPKPAGKK